MISATQHIGWDHCGNDKQQHTHRAATGGAATGGATTGGAPTGGAATGGAPTGGTASAFRGGPCVVSTNGTSIEVFARGYDERIYRKTVNGATQSTWANLSDLAPGAGTLEQRFRH